MKNTNFTYIAQLMNKLGQILESYFKKQEEVRSHAKNMVKKIQLKSDDQEIASVRDKINNL